MKQHLVQPREMAREQSSGWGEDGRDSRADQVISWGVNSITTGNSQREKGPIKGSHTATKENVILWWHEIAQETLLVVSQILAWKLFTLTCLCASPNGSSLFYRCVHMFPLHTDKSFYMNHRIQSSSDGLHVVISTGWGAACCCLSLPWLSPPQWTNSDVSVMFVCSSVWTILLPE